jgi:hypothetical protein
MLIILAKREDEIAAWLANKWQSHGAVLVTAADISTSGWSLGVGSSRRLRACVGNRNVTSEDIDGVVTRISRIEGEDLDHIVSSDRQYVASEMTAFLLSWLSGLTVPVLNRPTPGSLAGPSWRAEEWTHLASQLGIPVSPVHRKTQNGVRPIEQKPACEVTVVGGRCFGNAVSPLMESARTLAKAAGTNLLSVGFTGSDAGSAFVSANVWPDLTSPEIADAVLRYLLEASEC